jgi:hypothetical protein
MPRLTWLGQCAACASGTRVYVSRCQGVVLQVLVACVCSCQMGVWSRHTLAVSAVQVVNLTGAEWCKCILLIAT